MLKMGNQAQNYIETETHSSLAQTKHTKKSEKKRPETDNA